MVATKKKSEYATPAAMALALHKKSPGLGHPACMAQMAEAFPYLAENTLLNATYGAVHLIKKAKKGKKKVVTPAAKTFKKKKVVTPAAKKKAAKKKAAKKKADKKKADKKKALDLAAPSPRKRSAASIRQGVLTRIANGNANSPQYNYWYQHTNPRCRSTGCHDDCVAEHGCTSQESYKAKPIAAAAYFIDHPEDKPEDKEVVNGDGNGKTVSKKAKAPAAAPETATILALITPDTDDTVTAEQQAELDSLDVAVRHIQDVKAAVRAGDRLSNAFNRKQAVAELAPPLLQVEAAIATGAVA